MDNNMDNLDEEKVRQILREELESTFAYVFSKHIQILDGRNIVVGTGTGTKIGTESTQKIGLFGKSPVAQGSAITAAPSMSGTYVQSEQVVQCDRINNLITALENIGIIAEN